MDQELKSITIKSLIENLAIDNKFLTLKDIVFLKNKFMNSNRKLKDIEKQIKYEISKLEKKYFQKQKQEQKEESKEKTSQNQQSLVDSPREYVLYSYESRGITSSKKVVIEKTHIGEEDLNRPMHVLVNNHIKGYLKMKDNNLVDDADLAISQIGKLLNVFVTDIYRIEDNKHNQGILSVDIMNEDTLESKTIGSIINKHYGKVLNQDHYSSWVKELMSLPDSGKETPLQDELSLKTLIELGFTIIFEEYPNMSDKEKKSYKQNYFKMLVFDFLTNQLDRNSENFGILILKDKRIQFAPLYDNGCVVDYEHLNENSARFMMKICDKKAFIQVLFKYYFDEIKDFIEKMIGSKEIQAKIENIIDVYLDENDALWYKGIIDLNLKTLKKLYIEKTEGSKKKLDSTGYVRSLQYSVIVVVCCIILGFIIGLLFVIKTKY